MIYFLVSRNRASLPGSTCLENEQGLVKRMSGKNFPEHSGVANSSIQGILGDFFMIVIIYCYNYIYYFVNREFQHTNLLWQVIF